MAIKWSVPLLLAMMYGVSSAQDITRQEMATGPQVVEAVVDMIHRACVLPQDYFLLRRLAYVESRDGTEPTTFRQGFYGGIWQITQAMYITTKTSPYLEPMKINIANNLRIDWNATRWTDLLKPLYSGLGAALFVAFTTRDMGIPRTIASQDSFWRKSNWYFESYTENFTALASVLQPGCQRQVDLELAFIMDTSSSISSEDFTKSKQFVLNVTSIFDLDNGGVRVAVITYSSHANVTIGLGDAPSRATLMSAIDKLSYQSGGTETAAALTLASQAVFSRSRSSAVKVAVLITDGKSQDTQDTETAARHLKSNSDVLLLVVGVGDLIDENELHKTASQPSCTHVFEVASYDQIEEIGETIQHLTCRDQVSESLLYLMTAPLILSMNSVSCTFGNCPPYAIPVTSSGGIIKARSTCSSPIQLYSAYDVPYPVHSFSNVTEINYVVGRVSIVRIPAPQTVPTYFYVSLNQTGVDSINQCTVTLTALPYDVQVMCIQNGILRSCTASDLHLFAPELCP